MVANAFGGRALRFIAVLLSVVAIAALAAGCQDLGIDRVAYPCMTDDQCGDGWTCGPCGVCVSSAFPWCSADVSGSDADGAGDTGGLPVADTNGRVDTIKAETGGPSDTTSAETADEGDASGTLTPDACAPDCDGRACGDDGCGGVCGTCPTVKPVCEGGVCLCEPDCTGKACGPDGCFGNCGTCPLVAPACTDEGLCCAPDCAGKVCGDDGCGGICGKCDCPVVTFWYEASDDVKSVFVSGSFDDWAPPGEGAFAMTDPDGDLKWEVSVPLSPGTHTYKLVVDDVWILDPANPSTVSDGYGGMNSVLTIPDCSAPE